MGSVTPGYGFFPTEIWVFFYVAEGASAFGNLIVCLLVPYCAVSNSICVNSGWDETERSVIHFL